MITILTPTAFWLHAYQKAMAIDPEREVRNKKSHNELLVISYPIHLG